MGMDDGEMGESLFISLLALFRFQVNNNRPRISFAKASYSKTLGFTVKIPLGFRVLCVSVL